MLVCKQKPGDDFDWVTERKKCLLKTKFDELRELVKRDVETLADGVTFFNSDGIFGAEATDHQAGRQFAVRFIHRHDGIEIETADNRFPSFTASVKLNDFGECCFFVGDVELRSWELRKRALEGLFFVWERG